MLLSQRAKNVLSSTEAIGKGDGDYRKGEEKENHVTDLSTFPVLPGDSRFFMIFMIVTFSLFFLVFQQRFSYNKND